MQIALCVTFVERGLRVMESTSGKKLSVAIERHNSKFVAIGRSKLHPSHVTVVTILLWTDIRIEFIGDSTFVDAHKL